MSEDVWAAKLIGSLHPRVLLGGLQAPGDLHSRKLWTVLHGRASKLNQILPHHSADEVLPMLLSAIQTPACYQDNGRDKVLEGSLASPYGRSLQSQLSVAASTFSITGLSSFLFLK